MSPMGKCLMGICRHGYMSHGYMSPNLSVEEGGRLDSLFSTIVGDEGDDREM